MKVLRKLFKSRLLIVGLLVILQLVCLIEIFFGLAKYQVLIQNALNLLSLIMVLYLIRKDLAPAYKIAWLLLCCMLPLLGGAMYLLFGNKRPGHRLRRRMEAVDQKHHDALLPRENVLDALPPRRRSLSYYLQKRAAAPAAQHTQSKYYPMGQDAFADMLADLEKAERFIFLEYFILAEGALWRRMFEILKRKAAEGVEVRVIYDDIGSSLHRPPHLAEELRAAGIQVQAFNPVKPFLAFVMNHRDHRKITVVDGRVGYTGGINIADEYTNEIERFGVWKDTAVRLEGEAVWNLTVMFLRMWNASSPDDVRFSDFRPIYDGRPMPATDGVVQPFPETPLDEECVAEGMYLDILSQAERYVYFFTPYLIIDQELMTALCLTAKRGVDVRIGVPGIPDKKMVYRLTRSYFSPLLKAGVKLYLYKPGFLHAKQVLCDDAVAMVGTINLDYRSLYLHFEDGILFQGGTVLDEIRKDFTDFFAKDGVPVRLSDCRDGFFGHLLDDLLRLVSPMM